MAEVKSSPENRLKAGDRVPGYKFGQALYVPTDDIAEDPQASVLLAPSAFRRTKSAEKPEPFKEIEISKLPTEDDWDPPGRALLGLFQANEKWGKQASNDDSEAIIYTWRMALAKTMESLYVNLLVIVVVLIDIGSIVYFEAYQDPAEKDCFNRDHPIQARITIFALSCFAVELLLRGIGRGARAFFACRRTNIWNWFDIVIVGSSVILAAFKFLDDATHLMQCIVGEDCPPQGWKVRTDYSNVAVPCREDGFCPHIPKSPYAEIDDDLIDEALWLCDNEGVNSAQKVAGSAVSSTRVVSRIIVGLRIIRAITGVNRVRRVGSHIRSLIRARASTGTRRYRMLGFDLDLSYITNRCIAMAAPSADQLTAREMDGQVFGLNDANMVARLLAIRHYDKFRVYNMCEESLGDYAPTLFFSQVTRIPIKDRHPPQLKDVLIFCDNVARYLLSDPHTVVALHCSSGTGRSGVMAACWLLYSGHRVTAKDSLELFASRRSGKRSEDGSWQHRVRGASEKRTVSYLEDVLYHDITISAAERVLTSASLSAVLEPCHMSVQVINQNKIIYDSSDKAHELTQVTSQSLTIPFPEVLVFGDTELVFFRHRGTSRSDRRREFYICMHTAFYSGQSEVEFGNDEIDFVNKDTMKRYPDSFSVKLSFDNTHNHPKVAPFLKFRDQIAKRGTKKVFHRGDTIIEAGSKARHLYLVLKGQVSQVVEESWGLGAADTETVTVALLSEGDVFGAGAFCLELPETRHLCASQQVEVATLTIEDYQRTASDDTSCLEVAGYADDELPDLFRILAQLLSWEYMRNFKVSTMFTKVASSSVEDDHLRARLRDAAIKKFRIANYEECTFVHRCKVYEAGLVEVMAKRIAFFTRHIILDPRGSAETIGDDALMFKVSELEDAFVNYPEVQSLTIVFSEREYEVSCGTASAAKNLLEKFEALLKNEFFEFERNLLQGAQERTYLEPLIKVAPVVHYNCNDVLMEVGPSDQGIWHVVKGSLQVMDGKKRVAILEPGSLVGDMEYLTSSRMGFTVSVRSKEGADVHRLPRPLLDGLVAKREVALPFYLGMAGHFAGKIFSQLIVDKPSAYVSPEKERLLKLQAEAREFRLVKLLKLRKSNFLRMLNNDAIKELARGSRTKTIRKGQVLMKQGEPIQQGYNDVMYVVLSGTLRALLNNGLGMMEMERMTTGDVIGEQGVLLSKPRGATVEAVTEADLAEVKQSQVQRVVQYNPQLRENTSSTAARAGTPQMLEATMQNRMARAPTLPARADGSGASTPQVGSTADQSRTTTPQDLAPSDEPMAGTDRELSFKMPVPPTTPHTPMWGVDDLQTLASIRPESTYLSPPPAPPLPRRRQTISHLESVSERRTPRTPRSGESSGVAFVHGDVVVHNGGGLWNAWVPEDAIEAAMVLAPEHMAATSVSSRPTSVVRPAGGGAENAVYSDAKLVFHTNSLSARNPSERAQRLIELGKQIGMRPEGNSSQGPGLGHVDSVVRARKKLMKRAQSR